MTQESLRGELIGALRDVYHLEAFAALADMLQGESLVLWQLLERQGERVYPSELSQQLHLSRSRITGALSSLRRKGLIVMRRSRSDRRRIQVSATEEGLAVIRERVAEMEGYFGRLLDGLGEADARTLIGLVRRCTEVMAP